MLHDAQGERTHDSGARSPNIHSAAAQIEAARARQQRLIATGQLSRPVIDGSLPKVTLPGYTLLRELERGGQGVVYVAEQHSTGRQVAIKLLGCDAAGEGGGVRSMRFEREIEVLSRLKHPNVVTVHDCGRDHGRIYLVMDFVDGRRLDDPNLRERTSLRDTLEVFARTCDGVNAAHLRGVIHRDLKPRNILVDGRGQPHVLDFGLAKFAADPSDEPEAAAMTVTGQFVGSLPWASPEQAQGRSDEVDTRTDVYSLGVVFYQVLTGRFPYPVTGRLADVVRHIVETSPQRPSAFRPAIDRELETILLKCLAKEPERRYQNAGELARDLRRYLANEPIEARRDSLRYVLTKRLARYRVAAVAATAVLLIALSALAVSLEFWRRAEQHRITAQEHATAAQQAARRADDEAGNARRQTEVAQATVAFLTRDLLAGADTGQQRGRADVTVREMLDQTASRLDSGAALRSVPVDVRDTVRIAVRCAVARTYRALGLYDQASEQARAGVEAARAAQPPQPGALADALYELGEVHRARQESDSGRAALTEALALATQTYGENSLKAADLAGALAGIEQFCGHYAEAAKLTQQALTIQKQVHGERHTQVAMLMGNLAQCLARLGRMEEAAKIGKEAAEIHRELLGEDDHQYARDVLILGNIYSSGGDTRSAEPYYRRALELLRKLYSDEHPLVAMCRRNLGFVLLSLDQPSEAEELFRAALIIDRQAAGGSGALITNSLSGLGRSLLITGKYDEAERVFAELERVMGEIFTRPLDLLKVSEARSLRGEAIVAAVRAAYAVRVAGRGEPEIDLSARLAEAEPLLTGAFADLEDSGPGRDRFVTDRESRRCEACRRLVLLYQVWNTVDSAAPSDGERIRMQLMHWTLELERLREVDANAAYTTN